MIHHNSTIDLVHSDSIHSDKTQNSDNEIPQTEKNVEHSEELEYSEKSRTTDSHHIHQVLCLISELVLEY